MKFKKFTVRKKLVAVLLLLVLMLSVFALTASASTMFGYTLGVGEYAFTNACYKTIASGSATVYINDANVDYNSPYLSFKIYSSPTKSSTYSMSETYNYPDYLFNITYTKTFTVGKPYYLLVQGERRVVTVDGYWEA